MVLVFKDHYDEENSMEEGNDATVDWESVFDPQSGQWRYKTPYGRIVSKDPTCELLLENKRTRLQQASKYDGKYISYYPSVPEACECGVCIGYFPYRTRSGRGFIFWS